MRYLDPAGEAVLAQWLRTDPERDAVHRVYQVLQDVEYDRNWKSLWHTTQDPFTGHWIVAPEDGLFVVVNEFSDVDPEEFFSVTWVGQQPEGDDAT